jgi:hypothetical protein
VVSHLSLEYVKIPVAAVINGVAYDPHADVIKVAFTARGVDPVVGDWIAGSWESDGAGGWQARVLVGPSGDTQLAAGIWDVWLKVIDSPEVPVRKVGVVEVV